MEIRSNEQLINKVYQNENYSSEKNIEIFNNHVNNITSS